MNTVVLHACMRICDRMTYELCVACCMRTCAHERVRERERVFFRMSAFLKIIVRSQDIKDIASTEILNDKIAFKYNDVFDEYYKRNDV